MNALDDGPRCAGTSSWVSQTSGRAPNGPRAAFGFEPSTRASSIRTREWRRACERAPRTVADVEIACDRSTRDGGRADPDHPSSPPSGQRRFEIQNCLQNAGRDAVAKGVVVARVNHKSQRNLAEFYIEDTFRFALREMSTPPGLPTVSRPVWSARLGPNASLHLCEHRIIRK